MTNPWSPEYELDTKEAATLINSQFPQLASLQISLLGKGFDNSVFMVNQNYVFRFPRRSIAVDLLKTENQLLPKLADTLNFLIPNPVYFGTPSKEYPWPFTGYHLVTGSTPHVLSETERKASAEPLARFLQKLHQFPIEQAKSLGVPFDQLKRLNIAKRKEMLEENVKKAMDERLLKNTEILRDYLKKLKNVDEGSERALVHGDLHFRNIVVDSKGSISGIIDWGDVHIGHPAVDLSFVYSFLPPEGRSKFFEIYGQVDDKTKYLARFKAVYTSLLLLRYAHDQGDTKFVEASNQSLQLALTD